jgi:hypothetical protein
MSKLSGKTFNNIKDDGRNHLKGKNNHPSFDSIATIGERYKRMDLRIHMHFSVGLSEYCAIFQYVEGMPCERVWPFSPKTISKASGFSTSNLNNPMFVRIVDLFEPKEGASASMPFGPIYSFEQRTTTALVRLQPLNECLMFREEVSNHVTPVSPLVPLKMGDEKVVTASSSPFSMTDEEYRKLGVPCWCFRSQQRKLIYQTVKGRPQVVSYLADTDTPIKRRRRPIYFDAVDTLTRYRIYLCWDNVMFGMSEKGVLHQPESVDFTFCTLYLESRAIQWTHIITIQGEKHIV